MHVIDDFNYYTVADNSYDYVENDETKNSYNQWIDDLGWI